MNNINPDIPEEYICSFSEAFVCRADRYDKQQYHGGGYVTIYESLTLEQIRQHLNGALTIAGFTIDENNMCREIAFDEDIDLGGLTKINKLISGWGLKPVLEGGRWTKPTENKPTSYYKPGHLRLVLDRKIPSKIAYQFSHQVAAMAGAGHLECNPKAPELKPGGKGTVLKLPLAINKKADCYPDERAWFNGVEHDLFSQLKWVHEELPINSADFITRLTSELPPIIQPQAKRRCNSNEKSKSLLELLPDDFPLHNNGSGQHITGCPACILEGHDRSMSNLTINAEGNLMHCFYDGGGGVHNFQDILMAFQYLRQQQEC